MNAIIWLLAVLMLEMLVGLVLLGTWVAEGRRRAEELERIEGLLGRSGMGGAPLLTVDTAHASQDLQAARRPRPGP